MEEAPDVVDAVDLPRGRRLTVRLARGADLDAVMEMYGRLSSDDLMFRFFTARPPSREFMERWLTRADRAEGLVLVAEIAEPSSAEVRLIAEAGYSLLESGEGELGVTVDPAWRGWLGPWLLALLLGQAAERGVPNLMAIVKPTNRKMLSVMRHRRSVVIDHSDLDEIALVISTTGRTAGWPVGHERPRILVEASSGRWAGDEAARAAGFDIRTCRGPSEDRPCPLLVGEECPLVEGADAIVSLLRDDLEGTEEILAHHRQMPDVHLVVAAVGRAGEDPCDTVADVVAAIRAGLGID